MDITARKPVAGPSSYDYPVKINGLIDDLQQIATHFDTSGHFNFDGSVAGAITSSAPIVNATQTWNSGGVRFTASKINITDTASEAGSMFVDYQVGGVSKFSVTKSGVLTAASSATLTGGLVAGADSSIGGKLTVGVGTLNNPAAWQQMIQVIGVNHAALSVRATTGPYQYDIAVNSVDGSLSIYDAASSNYRVKIIGGMFSLVTSADATEATAQFSVWGAGYKLYSWLDATAAYIGQNSAARELRMYAGASPTTGVKLTNGATSWASTSDIHTKTDLDPIVDAAIKVATLRHVTGRYKTDDQSVRRSFLIAQDVRKVLPEAVSESEDGELNLRYQDLIPLHGAAIAEIHGRVTALESRVMN